MRSSHPQVGGSACLKARRNTKVSTPEELKLKSRSRAASKLNGNDELLIRLADLYQSLRKGIKPTQCHYENQDGMLIGLIGQGLSEQEIRSFIPVGGYKMARLRNEIKDPSVREKRLTKKIGPHAFTDADIQNLCDFVQSLEAADKFEDGFPCSHCRIKKHFKEEGLDRKKVWAEYVKVMQAKIPPAREMSYQRWLQYVHALYPQILLARSKEDECDACVALNIESKRDKTCSCPRSSFWAEKYSLVCEFEQSLSVCE